MHLAQEQARKEAEALSFRQREADLQAELAKNQQKLRDDEQRHDAELARLTAIIAHYNASAPPGVDQINSARCGENLFYFTGGPPTASGDGEADPPQPSLQQHLKATGPCPPPPPPWTPTLRPLESGIPQGIPAPRAPLVGSKEDTRTQTLPSPASTAAAPAAVQAPAPESTPVVTEPVSTTTTANTTDPRRGTGPRSISTQLRRPPAQPPEPPGGGGGGGDDPD